MPNSLQRLRLLLVLLLLLEYYCTNVWCEIDYNTVNQDGSFTFRHRNDDIGGYYHSASGSPDNIVRGRYGSRNPATGQIDEVVYTAGPRGFRANGPNLHRKMDLTQYPPRPIGSPDDPLADPYDDPSYSFSYRLGDQSRTENSDATGRVRGLYSYIDDEGERHSVRYAAGAGTGFEVSNAVPDNPANVAYTSPLYKAHPKTRGKMSVQRGPDGTYKLIAAGPDHRRAESRSPDGFVRGTYSFLDDKGVQRTVEYIAGAGIGYRVVKNRIGPGTHINPSVSEFRLTDTDFKLANDFGRGAGGVGALEGGFDTNRRYGMGARSDGDYNDGGGGGEYLKEPETGRSRNNKTGNNETSAGDAGGTSGHAKTDRMGYPATRNRGGTRYRGGSGAGGAASSAGSSTSDDYNDDVSKTGANRSKDRTRNRNRYNGSSNRRTSASASSADDGYNYDPPNNYNFNDDDVSSLPPLITANRKILEIDRERDWVNRHRDSTIIKNVGQWYIGLPPGQSVRAHVQNIDLVPLGGRRPPSPSEALRQDEIAEMAASLEVK